MRIHRGFSLFIALAGAACTSPPAALDEGVPDAAALDAPLDDGAPALDVALADARADALDDTPPPFDAPADADAPPTFWSKHARPTRRAPTPPPRAAPPGSPAAETAA